MAIQSFGTERITIVELLVIDILLMEERALLPITSILAIGREWILSTPTISPSSML